MEPIQTMLEKLTALGLNGLLLTHVSNIRYLTGYTGEDAYVLISPDIKLLITDARYTEQAQKECTLFEVLEWKKTEGTLEAFLVHKMMEAELKKVGFEGNYLSYDLYARLAGQSKTLELIPAPALVESLRMIKNTDEINCIQKAASFADRAFSQILEYIQPGMTENELTLQLEYFLRKAGSEGVGFPTILISGQKTSMPHGIPSHKKIQPGDFITMDFGGRYGGYRSDMTRTVAVGPIDERQRLIYELVLEAQTKAVASVRNGIQGNIPDAQVREVFAAAGYLDQYYPGLGHGVGLDIHETPFLGIGCQDFLKTNQVITIEPGLYFPGWGGVRIEDTLLIQENHAQVLTLSSKELIVL